MNRREFILASIALFDLRACFRLSEGVMNLQSYRKAGDGQVVPYSRSLADISPVPQVNDIAAILLAGNLYSEQIILPQQGVSDIRSLIYSFRPLFNLASTSPPNDGFSKTASPSYNDLPMVILENQTTGQLVYIGAGTANYALDQQSASYSVAPAFLAVQGSVPFYASVTDTIQLYSIQNQNSVARPVGFINLLFATFDIFPWSNTQGSFYNALSA